MHDKSTTSSAVASAHPMVPHDGVLVLSGYGITVDVQRGYLCCSDGRGTERRTGQFPRVPRPFRRLIIVGHSGSVSLDAIRWLHDVEAALVQLDADGTVLLASGPAGLDDARLRRAQALAGSDGAGIGLTRVLLRKKIIGQAAVLEDMFGAASSERTAVSKEIRTLIPLLDDAPTLEALRVIEADAAAQYWNTWESVSIQFARQDATRVPAHWQRFGKRGSLRTGTPRKATNPANALLNYLYAMLETESRLAALAVGLDPGMGILHADLRSRDSLACDLMEPIRPTVDTFVLDLLRTQIFARHDFFETREGICRVTARLTPLLAGTALRWASLVAPVAEMVAHTLFEGQYRTGMAAAGIPAGLAVSPAVAERITRKQRPHAPLPTPLTEEHRRRGRDGLRQQPLPTSMAPRQKIRRVLCQNCGAQIAAASEHAADRQYCDVCLATYREGQAVIFAAAGPAALATQRAAGTDPAHGGGAARKRGATIAAKRKEAVQWNETHGVEYEPEQFKRDFLPRLRDVSLSAIQRATGLSIRYCSLIRRGERTPHPRYWETLRALVADAALTEALPE